eukprot:TRINITY_DN1655_c0_g1_i3.p1 TRINITY_DN1655_c0_g1~~TRINITY_DN1655_c0_g1_i3.p1  ORF type:complete len:191 (+),score=17.80 TRINITY_DN1655_c0_g1_i3:54-575(+)
MRTVALTLCCGAAHGFTSGSQQPAVLRPRSTVMQVAHRAQSPPMSTLASRAGPTVVAPVAAGTDVVMYEESSKYADPHAVATDCVVEITSNEHLDRILATAAQVENPDAGYVDHHGAQRLPHRLIMIQVHANWCRACIGVRPKLLKLCARHPEVLCCKLNKGNHEVRCFFCDT